MSLRLHVIRSTCLASLLALAGLATSLPVVAQTQAPPTLSVEQTVMVSEGNAGLTDATINWTLVYAPPDYSTSFRVRTEQTPTPQAIAGVDFVTLPPTVINVAPGQTSGSFKVQIIGDTEIELTTEIFWVEIDNPTNGARTAGGGTVATTVVGIQDDDLPPVPPLTGNDDYISFEENQPVVEILVERNDLELYERLTNSVLTLTSQPAHGRVEQVPSNNAVDRLYYRPDPDFSGRDGFGYRLCTALGECVEARVVLTGQAADTSQQSFQGRTGGLQLQLDNLRAVSDVRFLPSTLERARVVDLGTTIDATPHRTWDSLSGLAWENITLPASPAGTSIDYRIRVLSQEARLTKIDLMLGIDANGDGIPSAAEQQCFSGYADATNIAAPVCEIAVTVGPQPVTYWIAVHSREATARTARLHAYQVRMESGDGKLTVTGPVRADRLGPLDLSVSWYEPKAASNVPLLGYVRIVDGDSLVGDFRVDLYTGWAHIMLPLDGTPLSLGVPADIFYDRSIFFDVPAGATRLAVTGKSDSPVRFAVTYYGGVDPAQAGIPSGFLPDNESDWNVAAPGGGKTRVINNPGWQRWHVIVQNPGTQPAALELTATLQAVAPTVRTGSYFNPKQPGSGLILYPAGNQWAGLWYTYSRFGLPTWYYLQAAKPGASGIWRSDILRMAWDGDSARSTKVGEMTVTPIEADSFLMSYRLDGFSGSQPMSPLGRGCPSFNGVPLDISSHWFDPARAGMGYSVQTWPNYEFFAAFTYDRQGVPIYLLAESAGFAGGQADLALEALKGPCPTCGYGGAPQRNAAGNLRRILANGTLSQIQLDVDLPAVFPQQARMTWSQIDTVQTLGGPGTTQGCEP